MRPIVLLLAVVVLCAIGPPSWAYYNPFEGWGGAGINIKLTNYDVGTQYFNLDVGKTYSQAELDAIQRTNPGNTTTDWKILPSGSPSQVDDPTTPLVDESRISLEDSWGILKVVDISVYDLSTNIALNGGMPIWQEGGTDGWEITAMFYHEKDAQLRQDTATKQTIWGKDLYAVFFAEQILTPADDPFNTGYEAGPAARGDGSGNGAPEQRGVTDSNGSTGWKNTGTPGNPAATDPVPLWTFRSVPGIDADNPTMEYYSEFSTVPLFSDVVGGGRMYASAHDDPYWGTGAGNWQWQSNPGGTDPPHALSLQFTSKLNTSYGWMVRSEDPVTGAATPELSSGTLMLLGLLPMGLVAWRRRKS